MRALLAKVRVHLAGHELEGRCRPFDLALRQVGQGLVELGTLIAA
jgi:hypothetical protein